MDRECLFLFYEDLFAVCVAIRPAAEEAASAECEAPFAQGEGAKVEVIGGGVATVPPRFLHGSSNAGMRSEWTVFRLFFQ
jgi:hypothetical protein